MTSAENSKIKFSAKKLNAFFGRAQSLKGITIDVLSNRILGIIGPSGSGKTTFLRALNRLNDEIAARQLGCLPQQRADLFGSRHDERAVGWKQRREPLHRVLEHRPVAHQSQRLLGPRLPTQWPQPCARPTSHDESVIMFCRHSSPS